jgi:hypothetical protein
VRTLFDFDECLRKGLLRKTASSKVKAKKSLGAAFNWLGEAEKK